LGRASHLELVKGRQGGKRGREEEKRRITIYIRCVSRGMERRCPEKTGKRQSSLERRAAGKGRRPSEEKRTKARIQLKKNLHSGASTEGSKGGKVQKDYKRPNKVVLAFKVQERI